MIKQEANKGNTFYKISKNNKNADVVEIVSVMFNTSVKL